MITNGCQHCSRNLAFEILTLGGVGEVTKLGLPHDQGVWRRQRVTVLETKDTVLAKMRVGDNKARLILAEAVQWSVCVLVLLVVEDSVTLRESTTLDILTGNSDVVALKTERTECKGLGSRHVDVLALVDSL